MKSNHMAFGKPKKNIPPQEIPAPEKTLPDISPVTDPEEPVLPAEPDFIPEEDPSETPPPYELPPPGEGP
jgi:hypothetical protein